MWDPRVAISDPKVHKMWRTPTRCHFRQASEIFRKTSTRNMSKTVLIWCRGLRWRISMFLRIGPWEITGKWGFYQSSSIKCIGSSCMLDHRKMARSPMRINTTSSSRFREKATSSNKRKKTGSTLRALYTNRWSHVRACANMSLRYKKKLKPQTTFGSFTSPKKSWNIAKVWSKASSRSVSSPNPT